MLLSEQPATLPINETYVWVTQVITAYDGHEERHRVRIRPRLTYQVTIPLNNKTEIDDLKSRDDKIRDSLQFVVWHAPYVGSARLATRRGHPWYFELGDKIAHWQPEVGTSISTNLSGAGIIYPVRDAIVDGGLRYSIRRGGGKAEITYNIEQAVEPPTGSFDSMTIEGTSYEVLELPSKSGFTQEVVQNQGYFDSVVGAYVGTTRWRQPKLQWSYTIEMFTPDDVLNWKQFIFRRAGRLNPLVVRDTDGRAIIMRLATDNVPIVYDQGYFTSTVPLVEVFV